MSTLGSHRIDELEIPISTGWLLADCMEARGKQDLWMQQRPEAIEALRELAIVQSIESSNRIEGVTVAPERLRPIALRKARPRDRSEEELAGYRRALDWIFSRKRSVELRPPLILRLHELSQQNAADSGAFKSRDNEIIELLPGGGRRVRFRPTPASRTAKAITALCADYRDASAEGRVPPLLAIATVIFDFLCIHPFRDGNGRVSRLLTTLLLDQAGFSVCRVISLERIVEERKAEYYAALQTCSTGWHEEKNQIVPWWNFFLGVVREAYRSFANRVAEGATPVKTELIRQTILSKLESFRLADLVAELPTASTALIKKTLLTLKNERRIRLEGRGRGAVWKIAR